MDNLFNSPDMAAGYARARPALHPRIIGLAGKYLQPLPVENALDVGCGAGLSTRALESIARHCHGIDPSESMIQCATDLWPGSIFSPGTAEKLPVPSHSIDLITAAGSLNYADLNQFFPEALRVLSPHGRLLVYDFGQGRSFRNSPALDGWFSEFLKRYPMPPDSGREISPETLASHRSGLQPTGHELFEIGLMLDPAFYINYVMTETNIAHAISTGKSGESIRAWCDLTIPAVFENRSREVLFSGYISILSR